jgi:hypothetical protein
MNPARSRFWWKSLGAPALTRAGQGDGLSQSGLLSLDLYQP